MVQITDLRLNKAKKRVSVYIDGVFSFTLNNEVVVQAGLHKSQDIHSDQIRELKDSDIYQTCLNTAMNFLGYRPRSEAEIKQRLHKRGFGNDIVGKVLTRLKEQKLIDDPAFAQYWRDNRLAFNPRSKRVIKLELRQKGINVETIDEIADELDDEESAYKIALKKVRFLTSLSYEEFRNYLYNHLRRRGFSYDVISCIVARLWSELHASCE
jgi:regulatory protein